MEHFDINTHTIFASIIENYDFEIKSEINDRPYYFVNLLSGDLAIEIENYHREIYVTLYKCEKLDRQINLFNLLSFLKGDKDAPKAEYFHKEKNIDECYKKQLSYIAKIINDNYSSIKIFFEEDNEFRFKAFDLYWKNKHPEFNSH